MAAHGAVRLHRMTRNLAAILGVEALCAAQGIEFRLPLRTSARLARVMTRIRQEVPALGQDRVMAPDMERASRLVMNGALLHAAGLEGGN